jgi:hypothetical protein
VEGFGVLLNLVENALVFSRFWVAAHFGHFDEGLEVSMAFLGSRPVNRAVETLQGYLIRMGFYIVAHIA